MLMNTDNLAKRHKYVCFFSCRPILPFIKSQGGEETALLLSWHRGETVPVFLGNIDTFVGCLLLAYGEAISGGSPMTCQSSESTETIENERRSDTTESRVVESDESRIALAMKDLKNTGREACDGMATFPSFWPYLRWGMSWIKLYKWCKTMQMEDLKTNHSCIWPLMCTQTRDVCGHQTCSPSLTW